jgi:filamentous hemagglutinin
VINSHSDVSDIDVGEYTVDTVIAGYDVQVNTKKIDELAMGISPMPTIKDMVSIPGMFEVSTDFKKTAEAEKMARLIRGQPTISFRSLKRVRQ